MKRSAQSLIRVSNAFLVKVRNEQASGGRTRVTPEGKTLKPVAAYFPAAPETMNADVDTDTGKVRAWRQMLPSGRYRDYSPDDVVHFTIDKREGFLFGIPSLIPVIDDIRALRQIEENIELLLYQHLFPLFQYKVGTENAPAGYTEDGLREIDVVKEQIKLMPLEGGIVTPERHEIEAIGSEGRAIRAEGYLTHFKKRVIAGLGISSVDLGDGETANRSTANTMSRALVDSVKDIQDSFESQWDLEVINELLLESTFGTEVLEEENRVHLIFAEIDIQNQMEQQKHASELFRAQGLTYAEYRAALNKEPITIPDDPEDQDMSKYPEWSTTYWKLFEEPLNLIRAVDEPFTPAAQAAAESRSLSITQRGINTAAQGQEKVAKAAEETKQKAKPAPKDFIDNLLTQSFLDLEKDAEDQIRRDLKSRGDIDRAYLLSYARTWAADISNKFGSRVSARLIKGYNDQTGGGASRSNLIHVSREMFQIRIDRLISRLVDSVIRILSKRVDSLNLNATLVEKERAYISELHTTFDSVRYRIRFIYDTELQKAYNYGRVLGVRELNDYGIEVVPQADACERCKALADNLYDATTVTIDDIIPVHPNCKCEIKVVTRQELEDMAEELEDGVSPSKLERCVLKVKQSLRKRYPGWGEKRIKSSAFAICNSRIKR
jgi:hypothetical protein